MDHTETKVVSKKCHSFQIARLVPLPVYEMVDDIEISVVVVVVHNHHWVILEDHILSWEFVRKGVVRRTHH